MKLEYYVMNYDVNSQRIEYFNIFRNSRVHKSAEEEIKKYLNNPEKYEYQEFNYDNWQYETVCTGFDAFVKKLDGVIRSEQWGRREYEISVADAFEDDVNKLVKVDCYMQAVPNMRMIAREVLWQYKHQDEMEESQNGIYVRDFRRFR